MTLIQFNASSKGHADCKCPKCKTELQDVSGSEFCSLKCFECGSLPDECIPMECPVCRVPLYISRITPEPIYKISALRV